MIQKFYYNSPCGKLLLASFEEKLCICDWENEKHRRLIDPKISKFLNAEFEYKQSDVIKKAIRQLEQYFAKERKYFDVPLLFIGTPFQKKVWNALLKIPYATTISYGNMAKNIGMSQAARALANANGANAISIFVPCHRVIGSDNSLTGYGGGLEIKKALLELENSPKTY